jgi:DNA-directed RNA polymerase sigma subunit (sigma70/sigma32)
MRNEIDTLTSDRQSNLSKFHFSNNFYRVYCTDLDNITYLDYKNRDAITTKYISEYGRFDTLDIVNMLLKIHNRRVRKIECTKNGRTHTLYYLNF